MSKDAYVDEYRQRIMELNEQRRDLWELVRKYENQPFVQISAHKEFHALIRSILQLYETLPMAIYFLIIAGPDSIYEDTTSKYPGLSA